MAKASATDQAHVVLAVGKEAILVQRVIEGVMSSARKADPAAVRQDIIAGNESAAGELANALSPSLFGEDDFDFLCSYYREKDDDEWGE